MMTPLMTRRVALQSAACGFGYLAFAGLSSAAAVDPSAAASLGFRLHHSQSRSNVPAGLAVIGSPAT